jgi:hypothetical protein
MLTRGYSSQTGFDGTQLERFNRVPQQRSISLLF